MRICEDSHPTGRPEVEESIDKATPSTCSFNFLLAPHTERTKKIFFPLLSWSLPQAAFAFFPSLSTHIPAPLIKTTDVADTQQSGNQMGETERVGESAQHQVCQRVLMMQCVKGPSPKEKRSKRGRRDKGAADDFTNKSTPDGERRQDSIPDVWERKRVM